MKMCGNCAYFNDYYKLCKRALVVDGSLKCVFAYNKACKSYKGKDIL